MVLAAHGWTQQLDDAALADRHRRLPTWQEYIATPTPTTPNPPRLTHIDLLTDPDTAPSSWPASTARTYTIEYTDDLLTGTWTPAPQPRRLQ